MDYRQFVRGYAVTSYAAQGKTVDYVLFSDSAVKAATNEQQWYVTISRGRKGVKIFTADKIQLRQNITHSGNRMLAMDMKPNVFQKLAILWGRSIAFVLNVQESQRVSANREAEMLRNEESERQADVFRQTEAARLLQTAKQAESVAPTEQVKPTIQKSETTRRRIEIRHTPNRQKNRGMRI